MRIVETTQIDLSPRDVLALMLSEEFQYAKAQMVDATDFSMSVEGSDSEPLVRTVRTMESTSLPEFIKPMVNPSLVVTETEHWQVPDPSGNRSGTFTIDVSGAPVSLHGRVDLIAQSTGCELTFSGELRASVPLFRSKVEQSAAGSVLATIHAEFDLLHQRATTAVA